MKNLLLIISVGIAIILIVISCRPSSSSKLEQALAFSNANRHELEKVLSHYSVKAEDSLKLKAAVFLIENMPGHFSYYGDALDDYLDSIHHSSTLRSYPWHLRNMFLVQAYRNPSITQVKGIRKVEDIHHITSEYLIDNIEKAFLAWQKPWTKHFSFSDFCEYLLPYRVDNEPIMNWRDSLINNFDELFQRNVDVI